jgi:hypothetical protein
MLKKIGFFAFIAGLVIALAAGIFSPQNAVVIVVLIILGLVIGFLNVSKKETMLFLVATIALIVVGHVFAPLAVLSLGKYLDQILGYVATLMAPAAIVAAVKAIWVVGTT